MTPRANEIKFRANGLGGGESPAETSCPVCGVGPQPSCGPERERWGWRGLLRFWNYRQEAWGLEEGPGQSWWEGGSAFLEGEIKHLGKQVLRTLLGPSAETAHRVSPLGSQPVLLLELRGGAASFGGAPCLPGGTGLPRVINKERKRYRRERSRERLVEVGQVGLEQVGEQGEGMLGEEDQHRLGGRNGRAEQFGGTSLGTCRGCTGGGGGGTGELV